MSTSNETGTISSARWSRREWLARIPLPAGAAFASAMLGARPAAAQQHASRADRGAHTWNVREFGAHGDGRTLDTAAVQAAIDRCTSDGGGTVLVPAGTFVIGTVELKSNVTLHLAAGATLLGSGDGKHYHAVDAIPLKGDSTLADGNWALLFAVHATNVVIEGQGTINGQGAKFHSPARGTPPPSGLGGNNRPYHLLAYACERLVVRDIELIDGAYHSIRVIQSRQVHMDNLFIHNRVNGNNDGFHFISAEYVTISNCVILSQDDACALFGSCKNVMVTNSLFSTRWSVFRFGGGEAENVTVSNCVLTNVFGCPIKFHGVPGSRFERMTFSNLVLDQVTGPICISLGPESRTHAQSEEVSTGKAAPAIARDISFTNLRGTVTTNPPPLPESAVQGSPEPGERWSCITLNAVEGAVLENISLSDIHLTFGGGGSAEDGARRHLPQIAGEYFMLGPMPAYALYARNVRALNLQNASFQVAQPELRPAVVFDNVEDVSIVGLSVQGNESAASVIRFQNTRDANLVAVRQLTPASLFLQVEGANCRAIALHASSLSKAAKPLHLTTNVPAGAVTLS